MKKKHVNGIRLALIAGATSFALMGMSASFAGEITGNGKEITVNGKSACAYSGREDTPGETLFGFRVFKGLLTQSWGQLTDEARAFFLMIGAHPGNACKTRAVLRRTSQAETAPASGVVMNLA